MDGEVIPAKMKGCVFIKNKAKDYINLVKGNGKFYNVYNEDAIILNYLLKYKILDNNSCGFP